MSEFEDKVVIVTGAGGGIGREHALAFARRGAANPARGEAAGRRQRAGASCTRWRRALGTGTRLAGASLTITFPFFGFSGFGHQIPAKVM